MRPADSIEGFVASPIGRYLRGRTYLVWCRGPRLFGSVHWSRSQMAEILELLQIVRAVHRLAAPIDVVTDARHVESTPGVVGADLAARFASEQLEPYRAVIRRHAIVHGTGLSGAVLAGFLPALGPGHAWILFSDPAAAYAWLSNPQAEAARLEVEELIAPAVRLPPTIAALRDYLARRGAAQTIAAAARALGASERSLQRRLREEGTTFRDELAGARVRAAVPLVLEGDLKLEAIARQLGFSSLTAFSRHYRRHTGELPSQARPRRAGASG
jgi:AraC-like DNA-binding protein